MKSFYDIWELQKNNHQSSQLSHDYLIPTTDKTIFLKDSLIDYSDFLCQPDLKICYTSNMTYGEDNILPITVGDGDYDFDNLNDAISYCDTSSNGRILLYKDSSDVINHDTTNQIYIYGVGNPVLSGGRTTVVSTTRRIRLYNCIVTTAMYWEETEFHYCVVKDMTATQVGEDLEFYTAYWCYFNNIVCGEGNGFPASGVTIIPGGLIKGSISNCKLENITIGGNGRYNGFYLFASSKNCVFGNFTFNKPAYDSATSSSGGYGPWICEDMEDCKWIGTWNFYSTHNSIGTNIQFLNNSKRCVFEGTFNFAYDGSQAGNVGSPRGGYVLHGSEECIVGGTWNFANGIAGNSITGYSYGGGGFGYGANGNGNSGAEGGYRDNVFNGTYNFGYGAASQSGWNYYYSGAGGFSGSQNSNGDGGRDLYWYSNFNTSCPVSAGSGGVVKTNKDSVFTTYLGPYTFNNVLPYYDKSFENIRKKRLGAKISGYPIDFDVSTTTTFTTNDVNAYIKQETDGYYYLIYTGTLNAGEYQRVYFDAKFDTLTRQDYSFTYSASFSTGIYTNYYNTSEFFSYASIGDISMYKWQWSTSRMIWRSKTYRTMAFKIEASENCKWYYGYPYGQSPYTYAPIIMGESLDGNEITIKYIYEYECEGIDYTLEKEVNWTPS